MTPVFDVGSVTEALLTPLGSRMIRSLTGASPNMPSGRPADNGISSDGELFGSPIHMVTKSAMRLVESFAAPLQRVQYSCRHCTADGHSQSVVFAAT